MNVGWLSLLLVSSALFGCATTPQSAATSEVQHSLVEISLTAEHEAANPYLLEVDVMLTAPSGRSITVPAFHDGNRHWRVRFAPDEPGRWRYATGTTAGGDPSLPVAAGEFRVRTVRPDFIRVDNANGRPAFRTGEGRGFIGIGDTAYGITSSVSDEALQLYARTRASQGFNFVRLFAAGYPYSPHPSLPRADLWPWGGSAEQPDYDRLNPRFFHRLEQTIATLKGAGLRVELELINLYTLPFTDPALWTRARERLWLREVVARLGANPAVFLWTIANEYENYPDGKYRYDADSDDAWVRAVAATVHSLDARAHPVTVHNFTFDEDGGVGRRFGRDADIAALSHQKWGAAKWNGRFLDGDAAGIEQAIWTDLRYGKPVINTENGYEWLAGRADFNEQVVGTDKARRAAWRSLIAGASAYAAGFSGTWDGTDGFDWKAWRALPFRVADSGFGEQVGHLARFLGRVDLTRLEPAQQLVAAPNLCLALPGADHVVYAPLGGRITLQLEAGAFVARWFDPRRGSFSQPMPVVGGRSVEFGKPEGEDWVLWLQGAR